GHADGPAGPARGGGAGLRLLRLRGRLQLHHRRGADAVGRRDHRGLSGRHDPLSTAHGSPANARGGLGGAAAGSRPPRPCAAPLGVNVTPAPAVTPVALWPNSRPGRYTFTGAPRSRAQLTSLSATHLLCTQPMSRGRYGSTASRSSPPIRTGLTGQF